MSWGYQSGILEVQLRCDVVSLSYRLDDVSKGSAVFIFKDFGVREEWHLFWIPQILNFKKIHSFATLVTLSDAASHSERTEPSVKFCWRRKSEGCLVLLTVLIIFSADHRIDNENCPITYFHIMMKIMQHTAKDFDVELLHLRR